MSGLEMSRLEMSAGSEKNGYGIRCQQQIQIQSKLCSFDKRHLHPSSFQNDSHSLEETIH